MFANFIMYLKYKLHICQQAGCWKHGDAITECWLPDYEIDYEGFRVNEKPDFYYCMEHAEKHGFCIQCGEFWGGIESFEFVHPGYCDNCHDQLEHDFDNNFDDDYYDCDPSDPYDAEQSFVTDAVIRRCPGCRALLEEKSVYCDVCGTDTPPR